MSEKALSDFITHVWVLQVVI